MITVQKYVIHNPSDYQIAKLQVLAIVIMGLRINPGIADFRKVPITEGIWLLQIQAERRWCAEKLMIELEINPIECDDGIVTVDLSQFPVAKLPSG